ncbi:transglycosylase domain-containing protein [Kibdelosporangium persicum]|uniref:Multimodular transpeptidase-transglycosylase n=1 Tax=Kibdelosporangium persicum TaxID=2698649 RepID=A0ABX2EVX9_9PSEU|nr:transglycosylase domain-containing protein [Kibdelosporangium persicum]NRN63191.1 Multimodular transpeptidase-transglycosylase [Kibdelosporangium persicum]
MGVRRNLLKLLGGCAAGGGLAAGILAPVTISAGVVAADVSDSVIRITPTAISKDLPGVTTITDRDGTPIASVFDQYRITVGAGRISAAMKDAVVSIEDRRFYQEHGIDPRGVARAAISDATGGDRQGGSTITQQLVKNYLINVVDKDDPAAQAADRADTLTRKIREARSAIDLDEHLAKDEILTDYLNVVEFTGKVYGVEAAARAYFGTTADKLTVPQAALLAGMVNNPVTYNPYTHPVNAQRRRDTVIDAMLANNAIDQQTATQAKAAPLGVTGPNVPASTCYGAQPDAGFFCRYAITYLEDAGLTEERLTHGGFTIKTTMDSSVSAAAKQAVDANVPVRQPGVANTMAIVSPGATSHEILALVANRSLGTDAGQGQTTRDLVADVSDPFGAGSVFKVFTAAAALEAGTASLGTPLPNPPSQCFPLPGNRQCYTVHNDGDYPDPITLADGLATSPNTAFVGLEQRVGLPAVVAMASRLGLRTTMRSNDVGQKPDPNSSDPQRNQAQADYFQDKPSFTLGNSPVSPLELANVPATLMSGGVWCAPTPILSVTDAAGNPVGIKTSPCEQALAGDVAGTLMEGLSKDTVSGTTAASARAAGWTRPDIGKTGTTQTNQSVAFVGGVDKYAVSSLVFADGGKPGQLCPSNPVHIGSCGHGAFGGTVAAPPYFKTMQTILGDR